VWPTRVRAICSRQRRSRDRRLDENDHPVYARIIARDHNAAAVETTADPVGRDAASGRSLQQLFVFTDTPRDRRAPVCVYIYIYVRYS